MTISAYIGTLHEDLADIAWRIHHLPAEETIAVWADACGRVLIAPSDSTPVIRPEDFIGNYDQSRTLGGIEKDLRAALHERVATTVFAGTR